MRRLGHRSVDVLKMDIEKAEWGVLRALLQPDGAAPSALSGERRPPLFCQLLIEVHFSLQVRKTPSWSRSWANFSLL